MSFEVNGGRGRGRGAHPYSVQTGMVFRLLSLKQGVQVHYLSSSPGCLFGAEPFKRVYVVPTMRNGTTPGDKKGLLSLLWKAKCAIFVLKWVRV